MLMDISIIVKVMGSQFFNRFLAIQLVAREKDKKVKNENEQVKDNESKEEKEEKDSNKCEEEEKLNDEERSEAENVIHELPSASSGEKREEFGKKLSAKEKLKQKLDKKKSSERDPARLLRHLSTQSSRLEDRLHEEDSEAQTAFERHDSAMKDKREKQSNEITAKDAFDFFTVAFHVVEIYQGLLDSCTFLLLKKFFK